MMLKRSIPAQGTKEEKRGQTDQTQYDVYKAEIGLWQKSRETLMQNSGKAYALIISMYCSKMIQERVEELPDYETKRRGDPIELCCNRFKP